MDENDYLNLARRDLSSLLAASVKVVDRKKNRRKRGGYSGSDAYVSLPGASQREIQIKRMLPIQPWEGDLLGPYGNALNDLDGAQPWVARAASSEVALRAISVQIGSKNAQVVENCLRFLLESAGSPYEGQPVNLNLLLDLTEAEEDLTKPSIDKVWGEQWHALLGSGISTGMTVDQHGLTSGLQSLAPPPSEQLNALRPYAFSAIGHWASKSSQHVALSLTRSGEVLVHQNGQLRLINRTGRWRGLPLEAVAAKAWSGVGKVPLLTKSAVLASVLDSCLGHHGAAIGIVAKGNLEKFKSNKLVSIEDRWPANLRHEVFPKENFRDLPRRIRLEMLSMDGATVIDYQGKILAAGAIVEVESGSAGGGRLAAAQALANLGVGIKVSQDGSAKIFRAKDGNPELVAEIG